MSSARPASTMRSCGRALTRPCCSATAACAASPAPTCSRRCAGWSIERERGELPDFRRIVIETSGLADPSPILQTFATDRALGGVFHVEAVVTVVDAVTGVDTLGWSAEARKQAILADRLIITKTDIAGEGASATLSAKLRALNPGAEILRSGQRRYRSSLPHGAGLRPAQYIRGGGRAQRRHWQFCSDRKCAAALACFCARPWMP